MNTLFDFMKWALICMTAIICAFVIACALCSEFRNFVSRGFFYMLRALMLCFLIFVIAIVYLVCPIDLIPDFIPVAGQIDDILVGGGTLLGIPAIILHCIYKLASYRKNSGNVSYNNEAKRKDE